MATIEEEPVPVLLIEDRAQHVAQIKQSLGPDYDVFPLSSVDHDKIHNYKALKPNSQIIIVDLLLDTSKEYNQEEGLETIRKTLWPIDRTVFFIVFSEFIETSRLPSLNSLEPHWVFIKKETEGDRLSSGCLKNLLNTVEKCRAFSSPILETPSYDPLIWVSPLNLYLEKRKLLLDHHHQKVIDNLIRSVTTLNKLAQVAAHYAKAGEPSRQIAIGIFGSCGRLEMREDSDIECTVYYTDVDSVVPNVQLAVVFWNMLTTFMEVREWRYEGSSIKSNGGLAVPTQADEELPNGYIPVITRENLMSPNFEKRPHLRNRHFQILTELRAVFNPRFILELKRDLVFGSMDRTNDLASVISNQYMKNLVDQFSMDLQPDSLNNFDDFKRYCYRTLNILAIRIWLAGRLQFEKTELETDDDWRLFFDQLADPGITKTVRFANQCLQKDDFTEPGKSKLLDELQNLIQSYVRLLARFSIPQQSWTDLKAPARAVGEHFISVLTQLKKLRYFKPIVEDIGWLLSTEYIESVKDRI